MDGIHQLPWFTYVDQDGNCHKPFLLPQEDPDYYVTDMLNYHRPELIIKPVSIPESRFVEVTYAHDEMALPVLKDVIEQQSLQVDVMTGATKSCKLYLLTIHNALSDSKVEF